MGRTGPFARLGRHHGFLRQGEEGRRLLTRATHRKEQPIYLSGNCLCGAVGFSVDGWVSRIQACHAERCRKATGGLFAPEIAASSEGFAWTGDTDQIATYEAPILHGPPAYQRNFCKTCGSPLPVELVGMMILHAGLLDDTTGLDVFRHAFTAQKSACYDITDDLSQHEGHPPAPDPTYILR